MSIAVAVAVVVVAVGHGANEFACVEQTLSRVLPVCIRYGHLMGVFSHLWPRH